MTFDFKNIYHKIICGSTIVVIEHNYNNQQLNIAYTEALYKNDNLKIVKLQKANTIEDLNFDQQNTPIQLGITGTNVLTKQIEKTSTKKAIVNAFPNLDIDDFYYDVFQTDTQTYVSVCSKSHIDKLLEAVSYTHLTLPTKRIV